MNPLYGGVRLKRPHISTGNLPPGYKDHCMLDILMLGLGIGAFALLIGYAGLCRKL